MFHMKITLPHAYLFLNMSTVFSTLGMVLVAKLKLLIIIQ